MPRLLELVINRTCLLCQRLNLGHLGTEIYPVVKKSSKFVDLLPRPNPPEKSPREYLLFYLPLSSYFAFELQKLPLQILSVVMLNAVDTHSLLVLLFQETMLALEHL